MRSQVETLLEAQRAEMLVKYVLLIQRYVRMLLCKIRFRKLRVLVIRGQKYIRGKLARIRYQQKKRGIVRLQSMIRGYRDRKVFAVMLDEYRQKKAQEEEAARIAAEQELERLRKEQEEAEKARQQSGDQMTAEQEAEERERIAKEEELLRYLEKSAEEREENAKKRQEAHLKKMEKSKGEVRKVTEADLILHSLSDDLHAKLEKIQVYSIQPGKSSNYLKISNEFPILDPDQLSAASQNYGNLLATLGSEHSTSSLRNACRAIGQDISQFTYEKYASMCFHDDAQFDYCEVAGNEPLTKLPPDQVKMAVDCLKIVVKYIHESVLSDSWALRHINYIAQQVQTHLELRDEVYIQVLRMTYLCPNTYLEKRAWDLLGLFLCLFTPSDKLLPYLLNHIVTSSPADKSATLQMRLWRIKMNGSRKMSLTYLEFMAIKSSTPMVLNTSFADGSYSDFEVDSASTVKEIVGLLLVNKGITNTDGYTLLGTLDGSDSETQFEVDAHIFDVIQNFEQQLATEKGNLVEPEHIGIQKPIVKAGQDDSISSPPPPPSTNNGPPPPPPSDDDTPPPPPPSGMGGPPPPPPSDDTPPPPPPPSDEGIPPPPPPSDEGIPPPPPPSGMGGPPPPPPPSDDIPPPPPPSDNASDVPPVPSKDLKKSTITPPKDPLPPPPPGMGGPPPPPSDDIPPPPPSDDIPPPPPPSGMGGPPPPPPPSGMGGPPPPPPPSDDIPPPPPPSGMGGPPPPPPPPPPGPPAPGNPSENTLGYPWSFSIKKTWVPPLKKYDDPNDLNLVVLQIINSSEAKNSGVKRLQELQAAKKYKQILDLALEWPLYFSQTFPCKVLILFY